MFDLTVLLLLTVVQSVRVYIVICVICILESTISLPMTTVNITCIRVNRRERDKARQIERQRETEIDRDREIEREKKQREIRELII